MSTETETSSTSICETVATVTPGDAVEFADEHYEWASPLDVVEATDAVEWDVPLGDDWWTRAITVEGSNGGRYAIVAVNDGNPDVTSYREDDGERDRRGEVVHLEPAGAADDDEHAVGDELPEDLDDEDTEDDGDDSELPVALPDHVSVADIEDAVAEFVKIGEVADALDVPVGRMRTILVKLDLYSEVREGRWGGR